MHPLVRTARVTGLFYFGLAVAGGLGFLLVRSRLFVDGDPAATLANLVQHPWLARAGVALELLTVLTQALAAMWFYRLFRGTDPVRAASIAAFGLVNATVILMSAALLGTAARLAAEPFGDPAAGVQLLYLATGDLWGVGGLFFGLWLIPMGQCVLGSGWLPRPLGWLLIAGGVGYVIGALVRYLVPGAPALADALAYPATVGELWIVGYLLVHGVRRQALDSAAHATPVLSAAS